MATTRIVWGGIGFYDFTSSGTGAFGINAGGAVNVAALSPDVPLAVWGNIGIVFPTGATAFPLTAGVAVRYDKLPVQLLGGAGLTVMPLTGGTSAGVGLALQSIALLPLPQVSPNFSLQGQLGFHILSNSLSLFNLTFGAGWAL